MNVTTRTFALVVAALGIAILAARFWTTGPGPAEALTAPPAPSPSMEAAAPHPVASRGSALPRRADLVSYAVALDELHGLPPNAAPGSLLDIWVAWEPPVTKRPRIDRLLGEVVLEEIEPPILPDGPHAALLLVPEDQITDLLYGDRYGSLSVTIPQQLRDSD